MAFLLITETLKTIADCVTALALTAIAVHEIFGSNGWRKRGSNDIGG